jgi:sulfur-carrier protein
VTEIRVELPTHLRTLARVDGELRVAVDGVPTIENVLDALELRFPVLKGTIRDHATRQRRPFIRYFAEENDLSHHPTDTKLPDLVMSGADVFRVIGAIAGG